jgi:hypothetical protein
LIRGDVGVSALHSLPVDAGATVTASGCRVEKWEPVEAAHAVWAAGVHLAPRHPALAQQRREDLSFFPQVGGWVGGWVGR